MHLLLVSKHPQERKVKLLKFYKMFSTIIAVLRAALQVILLIIFMWYFGFPALERYNENEVIVVTTRKATDGIASPTLTLLVQNPIHKTGWKKKGSNETNVIESYCQGLEDEKIVNCIKNKTYKVTDGVKDVLLGYTARESLLGDGNWSSDFQMTYLGQSYTIQIPRKLTPNFFKDQLMLELNKSLIYNIYIHDKDFFIVNENPYGLPMPLIKLNPTTDPNPYYYQLVLTEHEELNVPADPCTPELGYNFQVFSISSLFLSIIPGLCERKHFQQGWLQTPLGHTEHAVTARVFNPSAIQVNGVTIAKPNTLV